ncbi:MAG: hypothetical protein AAFP80_07520 [Pseudomonadota bacterium]
MILNIFLALIASLSLMLGALIVVRSVIFDDGKIDRSAQILFSICFAALAALIGLFGG